MSGTLSSEDAGRAALNVTFEPAADDPWHSSHAVGPLPGSWVLKLVVEFGTAEAITSAAHLRVW